MDTQFKSVEEQQFLEAIALQLNLTGDTLATFLVRFNRKNAGRENVTLVSFIAWNKEPKSEGEQKGYARQAIALLIRESDKDFCEKMINFTKSFSNFNQLQQSKNVFRREEHLNHGKSRLISWLSEGRNLKLDWQFSDEQKQILNHYYAANKLLVDCLEKSKTSAEVRQEIEETLLLPIAEIKKRKLR